MGEEHNPRPPEFGASAPEFSEPAEEFFHPQDEIAPAESIPCTPDEFSPAAPQPDGDRRAGRKEKRHQNMLVQLSSALLCATLAVSALGSGFGSFGSSTASQRKNGEYDHVYLWYPPQMEDYFANDAIGDPSASLNADVPLLIEIGWKGENEPLGIQFTAPDHIQEDLYVLEDLALHENAWEHLLQNQPEDSIGVADWNSKGPFRGDYYLSRPFSLDGHYEIALYRPTPGSAIPAYVRVVQHGNESVYRISVTQDQSAPLSVCAFDFTESPDDRIFLHLSYDRQSTVLREFSLDAYWEENSGAVFELEYTGSLETVEMIRQLAKDEQLSYHDGSMESDELPLAEWRRLSSAELPASYAVTIPELPSGMTPPRGEFGLKLCRTDGGSEPVTVTVLMISDRNGDDGILRNTVTLRSGEAADLCTIRFD